jgi:hypothetical protein
MTAAASHRVRVRPGRRFPLGATPRTGRDQLRGVLEGVGAARPGPPAKVHSSDPICDPAHHLVEQLLPAGRIYL